jgi:hypothetical protein
MANFTKPGDSSGGVFSGDADGGGDGGMQKEFNPSFSRL